MKTRDNHRSGGNCIRCSVLDVGCSMFPNLKPRYFPWFALSNRPEYRIGIPRRCINNAALSIVIEESSRELPKKQFDRIGNRMDHLMIVMAAGKTLIVSNDSRGKQVVGCQKLVTRTGAQQAAARPAPNSAYLRGIIAARIAVAWRSVSGVIGGRSRIVRRATGRRCAG